MSEGLEKLFNLLEEMQLKSTALSLKNEIKNLNEKTLKMNNDVFAKIYTYLQNNYTAPTTIKQKEQQKKPLNNEKNEKILDNLVEKLCKKVNFNEDETTLKKISNTKIFKQLMSKLDSNQVKGIVGNTEVEKNEEELPHFGASGTKKTIDANRYDSQEKERVKINIHNKGLMKSPSIGELLQNEQSPNSTKNKDKKNILQNPNNTMNKNESQLNDDSIFKENASKKDLKFVPDENLENMLNQNQLYNMMQNQENINSSSFFQNSHSIILPNDNSDINLNTGEEVEEYVDDDDPGFDLYECYQEHFKETCKKLSEQYGFPKRAIAKTRPNKTNEVKSSIKDMNKNEQNSMIKGVKDKLNPGDQNKEKDKKNEKLFELSEGNIAKKSLLPNEVKFMESGDSYYPLQYNNTIYDCFNLKVIIDRERTGFEETKEFKIVINSLIAGRYQILEYLGSAAFSKAVKCIDIQNNRLVCLKIIENNKDYVDQSVDEIKLLRYINANGDADEKNVLKLYDCFYHKEHLFIVTELLKDNLYEFYKYINENNFDSYFTLGRLQKITKQILIALDYIHSLKIIHCDLKPENILIKSINNTEIKVIDFGASCFIHDHLSSYVQSRSYRAPEVILGCKYDYKIDMWSLGCILAELYTGNVLFQNDSVQSLLARIIGIIGPIPEWMYEKGKLINDYFTKEKLLFMEVNESPNNTNDNIFSSLSKSKDSGNKNKSKKMHILIPKRTSLRKRIKTNDENFFDFLKSLLEIDSNFRISASEALNHPWIKENY